MSHMGALRSPVVSRATLTEKGAEAAFQGLPAGVVSIIIKPRISLKDFLLDGYNDLISSVRAVAIVKVSNIKLHIINAQKVNPSFK